MAESRAETQSRREAAPWPKVRLGEICDSISDGDHLPPPKSNEGIPFITISDIGKEGEIDFSNCYHVPCRYYDKIDEKRKPRQGDILYTVVGSFGKAKLVGNEREFCFQRHIAILRPNYRKIDSHYLYSQMRSQAFFAQADAFAIGVAQRTISLSALRRMTIPLPSLPVQRAIAGRLAAYDHLIENNRRRIAILERKAQQLYKEWFVRRRFPGHEKAKFTDGLPVGWRKETLENIAEITMGQSPESSQYNTENKGLPFHQGVTGFRQRFPINEVWCIEGKRFAEEGDILFSVRAPVGRINIATEKIVIGRGLSAFRSKDGNQSWLFYLLKDTFRKEDMIGTGSIFASTTKKELFGVKVILPEAAMIEKFENKAKPIDALIANLQRQNALLAKERDLLLPRLMSGSIEVKHV